MDPFIPEVKLQLGSAEYTLCFPLPSIFAIEDQTGLDILGGGVTEKELMGTSPRQMLERVIVLAWCGLHAHHPTLSKEDVGKNIFLANMAYVRDKVLEAFYASLPRDEKPSEGGSEESPLAAQNQTE